MLTASPAVGELEVLTWVPEVHSGALDSQVESAYRAMDDTLRAAGASVLQERIFASLDVVPVVGAARARATCANGDAWILPPTCVEGRPATGAGLAGIHVLAVRGTRERLIAEGRQVIGREVDVPGARILGLADVRRATGIPSAVPAEDMAATIDAAERVLAREGFDFRDVVRTWFYLRDILDCYDTFNQVRSAAFRRMLLIGPGGDGTIPASTGIGGRGATGGWATLDLVAIRSMVGQPLDMVRLHNRRQNEATEYGSAFARGMSLSLGDRRYLFISGTAAIDTAGRTVYAGDVERQSAHTAEAVAALLQGSGASLADVRQATAFVKRPVDAPVFTERLKRTGLDGVPLVTTVADVCRDDLLVELDAIAVIPRGGGSDR